MIEDKGMTMERNTTQAAPPSENTPEPPKAEKAKRRRIMLILAVTFASLLLLYFIYWIIWGRFSVYTDDAYVNGNMVALMPQISGTVTEIYTDDTQLVVKGQPVVKLDQTDTLIALQKAKANLGETVRQVRQYFENAQQALALVVSRKADLVKAQLDLDRRVGLVGKLAVSKEELQHVQTALYNAKAAYREALHQFLSAYALVENAHLYTHPFVERAKAQLKEAYVNQVRTTILAPLTGYCAKRGVNVGQQVSPQTSMLSIVPLDQIWVDANYKETQLRDIRINQPVSLYADAYSNISYHGRIVGLNAGTGAAFAVLPPQNATGNWIKIVQRLAVRVAIDPKELAKNNLQLGLSMHVTTDIRDTSGKKLSTVVNTKPFYATNVFANQLKDADQLIKQILSANSPDMFLPRVNAQELFS